MAETISHPEDTPDSTAVIEVLDNGDMHMAVMLARAGRTYRVEEQLYTDEPVYDFEDPPMYPLDSSDPNYLGQHLAGAWDVFDCTGDIENENSVCSDVRFEVEPGMLGCLMDVVPGSRWYRAVDEVQAQNILNGIMERLLS